MEFYHDVKHYVLDKLDKWPTDLVSVADFISQDETETEISELR